MRRGALPDQSPILVDLADVVKRQHVRLSLRIGNLAGKVISRIEEDLA